jgi:hypothetical protein
MNKRDQQWSFGKKGICRLIVMKAISMVLQSFCVFSYEELDHEELVQEFGT